MKKNLTKIMMMALCLCMMVAMFVGLGVMADAADPVIVALEQNVVPYSLLKDGTEVAYNPVVVVYDQGSKVVDTAYAVTYKGENVPAEGFTQVGVYELVVNYNSNNYKINFTIEKAVTGVSFSSYGGDTRVYGAPYEDNGKVSLNRDRNSGRSLDAKVVVEYFTADGVLMDSQPTDVGEYKVRCSVEGTDNYGGSATTYRTFTIVPKDIEIKINDGDKVYGCDDPTPTFDIVDESVLVGNDDKDDLKVSLVRGSGEDVGTYQISATWDDSNYNVIPVNKGTFTINPRLIEFSYNDKLTSNGKLQLPEIEIANLVEGDVCEFEVLGARKYGGKYNARVISISNPNYTLGAADVKLPFEIVADGDKDGEIAVDKIETGLGNAGSAMESIAPTLGNIGGSIVDTIVAVFKAIFADFFSRVFGA